MTHPSHQVPWISGVIPLQLVSKSNSRRLVKIRGSIVPIKSKAALEFMAYAMTWAWTDAAVPFPWTFPVVLTARCYYASRRPDLDVALLMDWLQARGIILNDRAVHEIHAYKFLDPKQPRVEWEIRAHIERNP